MRATLGPRLVKVPCRCAGSASRSRQASPERGAFRLGWTRCRLEGLSWFPLPRRDVARDAGEPPVRRARPIADVGAAIVDCGVYDTGHRQGGRIDLESALRRSDECSDGFVWIGLHDPSPEVVEAVGQPLQPPPLAVEDAVHAHQRAKLEVLGDTLFLVLKTARYASSAEPVEIGEVMVFAGPRIVVTVRHGDGQPAARRPLGPRGAPGSARHRPALSALRGRGPHVDDYAEVIERLARGDRRRRGGGRAPGRRANPTRAHLQAQARGAGVQARASRRSPADRAAGRRAASIPVDPRTASYFRDVSDHLMRDAERIVGVRRAAHRDPAGELRAGRGARQPGPAQDLELGGDHRSADDGVRDVRDELRAHARARRGGTATRSWSWSCLRSAPCCDRTFKRSGWL